MPDWLELMSVMFDWKEYIPIHRRVRKEKTGDAGTGQDCSLLSWVLLAILSTRKNSRCDNCVYPRTKRFICLPGTRVTVPGHG